MTRKPQSLTERQHALACLGEECTEVATECLAIAKLISKMLRFGIDDQFQEMQPLIEQLQHEWSDLAGAASLLSQHGIALRRNSRLMRLKRDKIKKFMEYAADRGMLRKE